MRVWIKKHIGLSIGIGILLILLLVCSGTILIWSNYSKINRTLWEWSKPERYYIKISYSNYVHDYTCSRTWESAWEGSKLTKIISDEVAVDNFCTEEDLNTALWSMDYVFDVIVKNCGKGTVLCDIDYDLRFHYPARVTSLYQYSFEVQDFVACDIGKPSCP
jgi:hypothetical protein